MSTHALSSTLKFLGEREPSRKAKMGSLLVEVEGVTRAALGRLSRKLMVSEVDLFTLAGGAPRAYYRLRQKKAPIEGAHADSVLRIARILEVATRVLGDGRRARAWLKDGSPFLDGRMPLELLKSDAGAQLVERELVRIHWGDY